MDAQESSSSPSAVEYIVTGGHWNREYQVTQSRTTIYHVENKSTSPNKPHLLFFAGNTTEGPVVGSAHTNRFSSDVQITLGDPNLPKTVTAAKLSKKGLMSFRYVIELEVDRQRRTFTWKRTEQADSFGPTASLKLTDEANEVVAVFLPGGGRVQRDGVVRLYADLGESVKLMTFIAALALREKTRSRAVNPTSDLAVPVTYS
ncbi:hypothetical protein N7539_009051 [Penicillium diatomitis]|uniref:Uncharacterized protein n=1 Tax=Penicillium diatomitis TaxID=2819901 RepID=A0A9X0BJJ9_9EURO|nr:uncharacterized protein N7539_009051 [Penicillium diatomitis]KAJ5469433.1 hypothetical protein N7539_009051 [Penicillium diatomitis]